MGNGWSELWGVLIEEESRGSSSSKFTRLEKKLYRYIGITRKKKRQTNTYYKISTKYFYRMHFSQQSKEYYIIYYNIV